MSPPPLMRKRAVFLMAPPAAVAITVFGLSGGERAEYLTVPVERADLESAVLATGQLQPWKQVEVGAQVSGQLKSLKVVPGQTVKKGDWLAEIDPVLARNTLEQAQAGLQSLQAQKSATQARLQLAQLNTARQHTMLEQDAAARQDADNADAELRALQADVHALDAQIRQQRLAVSSAQESFSYTRIVAPIDGQVVDITTQEGQTMQASFQVPTLMKLADLSVMTVKAQVSEADVVRIHEGQRVYFTILGNPDKRYHGKLGTIRPAPENINNAVFYSALFNVPNPDRALRVNMTAQIVIVLAEAKQTLAVPTTVLGARGPDGRYEVRVLRDKGKIEPRQVRIGISNNIRAQVLDGLREGENVIAGESTASSAQAAATSEDSSVGGMLFGS